MKSTAETVTVEEPLSFSVTVRLALLALSSRLMPLKPESRASWSIWPRMRSNCAARPARTVVSVVCFAWLASAWADCTSLVIEVMPLLAAWIVLMPLDIESSRLLRSLARFDRPCAVKKLIGLSRAELTRLPVASLVWVVVIRSAVLCNCRRLDRTPAVRTMSLMTLTPPDESLTRSSRAVYGGE